MEEQKKNRTEYTKVRESLKIRNEQFGTKENRI